MPRSRLQASSLNVGLPEGQMGNSEVGHTNLGAGRVVMQDLPRIDAALADGSLHKNPVLIEFINKLQSSGGTCHLMGLLSPGGVHSHTSHLVGLTEVIAQSGVPVIIHAFLDGRDTPPKSALSIMQGFLSSLSEIDGWKVGTVTGRYYAMDRDNRWERVEKAYRLLTEASPVSSASPLDVVKAAHSDGTSDEFLEPVRFAPELIEANDALVLFNFRPDRMRQLTAAFVNSTFQGFERQLITPLPVVTFTQYDKTLPVAVAFPPESLDDLLGEVVARAGLRQFRTAETEKYPHVTYFLNGGMEKPFPGEDRHLVPSPKVATYDQSPHMSADELTDGCVAAIKKGIYSLVVINYANPDMVGHTGDMEATVEAIGCVDRCIGRILDATGQMGGTLLITADHGNAEMMQGPDQRPWTAHTTNPVPFVLVEGEKRKLAGLGGDVQLRSDGGLADIAPTVLQLLNIPVPAAMSGQSLVASTAALGGRTLA